jgi:hypothetical protein
MSMKITIVAAMIALVAADAMGARAQTTPSQPSAAVAKPITLSISPTLVFNTGGDENPRRSAFAPYQVTVLGFRFGYNITKRLTIYWNHATPNTMNGRYYNDARVAVYGTPATISTTPTDYPDKFLDDHVDGPELHRPRDWVPASDATKPALLVPQYCGHFSRTPRTP